MTEKQLAASLKRAADALVRSSRITIRSGRAWPTKCTVPSSKVDRLAAVLNKIEAARAR